MLVPIEFERIRQWLDPALSFLNGITEGELARHGHVTQYIFILIQKMALLTEFTTS